MQQTVGAKIKVLHVTEARRVAGTERTLLMLLDHHDSAGFAHTVVVRGSGSFADELAKRKTAVATIPRWGKTDPFALARFAALVLREKPDIVHIYGGRLEAIVARALGVPVVERKNVFRGKYYRPALNSRRADALLDRFVNLSIAPAAAVKSHYVGRGYDADAICVVYNGVEPAAERTPEQRMQKRMELGLSPDAFVVAFAGRLRPEKGVDTLLSALTSLPGSVCCVIMGDGLFKKNYEELAHDLGLNGRVVFTGYRSDVPDVFACSDAVAVPSISDALANVMLEALAEGKPVIGTAVEGQPEAIEHGVTGLLIPPNDAAALSGAISALAANPELASRMGEAGKRRALSNLTPERMTRETENIYRSLLHCSSKERKCHVAECR